jgi:hypothetical protein
MRSAHASGLVALLSFLATDAAARSRGEHVRRIHERGLSSNATQIVVPHLKYYGGRVIANLKVQAVFWKAPTDPSLQGKLDAFYTAFLPSAVYGWLTEYSTNFTGGTGDVIGPGSYLGSKVITPMNTSAVITTQDIADELTRQIMSGNLPSPDGNTLYTVHLAPNITINDPDGAVSCQQYCAFHSTYALSAGIAPFAIFPDFSPGSPCNIGCGEALDWVSNLTSSISHEVSETTTDPDIGLFPNATCGTSWCDPAPPDSASYHGEIGDICEFGQTSQGTFVGADSQTYTVQRLWSNANNGCITTDAQAFQISVTPAEVILPTVGTATFVVSAGMPASGPATVNLTVYELPPGLTATFDSPSIAAGTSTNLSILSNGQAPFSWTFGVGGDSGPTNAIAIGAIAFSDFTATGSPATLTLTAGASATATITTKVTSGTGAVPLSFQLTAPPGVTASYSPASPNAGTTIMVTFTAAVGTASSTATPIVVSVDGGRRQHPVSFNTTIDGDDFGATLSGTEATVAQGGTAHLTVTTTTKHGAAQPLALTVTGLPSGVTAAFDTPSINSGATATLTFAASHSASIGASTVSIVATGLGSAVTLPATLTVSAAAGCGCGSPGALVAPIWVALFLPAGRRRRFHPLPGSTSCPGSRGAR